LTVGYFVATIAFDVLAIRYQLTYLLFYYQRNRRG